MSIMTNSKNLHSNSKKSKKKICSMKAKYSADQIKEFKSTGKLGKKSNNNKNSLFKKSDNKLSEHEKLLLETKNKNITKIQNEPRQEKRKNPTELLCNSAANISSKKKKNKKQSGSFEGTSVSHDDCQAKKQNIQSTNQLSSLPQVGFTWGSTVDDLNLLQPNLNGDSDEDEEEVRILCPLFIFYGFFLD